MRGKIVQFELVAAVQTHGWFAACKDIDGDSFSLWQADPSAA